MFRSPRWILCGLWLVFLAACSGTEAGPTVATRDLTTTVPDTEFCRQAVAFNDYLDERGNDLYIPVDAKIFLAEAKGRLVGMSEVAPEPIVDDINTIVDAYVELDATLAEAGYDLLVVDEAAFQSDPGAEASLRLDNFLFDECGFDPLASVPFEGEAPSVLSDDEVADMIGGDADEQELVDLLAEQFVEEFGLAPEAARCLAENMDRDSVVAIAAGGAVTDEVASDFASTLSTCGIDEDQMAG